MYRRKLMKNRTDHGRICPLLCGLLLCGALLAGAAESSLQAQATGRSAAITESIKEKENQISQIKEQK